MTQREFIVTLEKSLYFLPPSERREIINDYEDHFRIELASGRNEFQIASDLGNPADIAAQFREEAEALKAETLSQETSKKTESAKRTPPAGAYSPQSGQNTNSQPKSTYSDPFEANYAPQNTQIGQYPAPSQPQKRSSCGSIVGIVLLDFFTVIFFLPVLAGLWAAGLSIGASLLFAGAIYLAYSFTTFATPMLTAGAAVLCVAAVLLGVALLMGMIKVLILLVKAFVRLVKKNIRVFREA